MLKSDSENSIEKVSNLKYLEETTGGRKHLMREIIDVFLVQISEELKSINDAIAKINYAIIKSTAHSMKSTVSVMGISVLAPILQEMQYWGKMAMEIEKIKQLNQRLNSVCIQAIKEIEIEKLNYV